MVLDRLFLWVFGLTALIGSIFILTESPYLFEESKPIDVLYSRISKEEDKINEIIFV